MKGLQAVLVAGLVGLAGSTAATDNSEVQARIDADLAAGLPIVVHVVVALCDNETQGIVPVPESLGKGQDPKTNLYWGALYGLRTHFARGGLWTRLPTGSATDRDILERALFFAELERAGERVPVYVVADAWNGAKMRAALTAYLSMTAGRSPESVRVVRESEELILSAGGQAQLVAFVGHDGLMDFSLAAPRRPADERPPRSAIVLACSSKSYFGPHLREAGAHELLLTTGLMAPEAYTLDAGLRAWVAEGTTEAVIEAAARAYHRYQKCGLGAARSLFWGAP